MLNSVTVLSKEHQKRIKCKEKTFAFLPGLNFLIGSNGSGKSTLFDLILDGDEAVFRGDMSATYDEMTELRALRMNQCGRNIDMNTAEGSAYTHGLMSRFISHGESLWPMLQSMVHLPDGATLLVDEPEQALDAGNLIKLRKLLIAQSSRLQIIIATHNPIFLSIPSSNIINLDKKEDYLNVIFKSYGRFVK